MLKSVHFELNLFNLLVESAFYFYHRYINSYSTFHIRSSLSLKQVIKMLSVMNIYLMSSAQQNETDRPQHPKPSAQPPVSSLFRPNLLNAIPSPSAFQTTKGFTSFYNQPPSSPTRTSPTRYPHPQSLLVSRTLAANRTHLSQLRTRISTRRKTEYDGYIANSMRYSKLLELNNTRSKILTSLNKKVGEVKVTVLDKRRLEDMFYEVQESRVEGTGWKPEAREGQVCILYRDWVVLAGGHNNSPLDTICFFSVTTKQWIRNKCLQSDLKRTYHSGVLYKNHYIILFGGMSSYNSYYKTRECLNTCTLLTLNMSPPSVKRIKISNQNTIEARRCHSAVLIGKFMLVFGGINTKKEYLNDLKILDLKELKWESKEYKVEEEDLDGFLKFGLAKHCAFTYFNQRQGYPLYSKTYEEKQGIYIFGGSNQIGNQNLLLHFTLKWRTPHLSKLYPSGFPPSPCNPIISHHSHDTFLIISGQRQQRQICLYRVLENQFVQIRNTPKNLGGVGSSLVANGSNGYYVMFGLGEEGYIGTTVELRVREKYREKVSRKRTLGEGGENNRQSRFFSQYEEDR